MLGGMNPHEDLVRASLHDRVGLKVIMAEDRPTVRKRRFVMEHVGESPISKLFEVYYMDDKPLPDARRVELSAILAKAADDYDLVVVCDFGHGMLDREAVETLTNLPTFLAVNAQTNAGNMGYNHVSRYRRADFVCIDEPEARIVASSKHEPIGDLIIGDLVERIDCGRVIVTIGRRGCVHWSAEDGLMETPGFGHSPIDTMGSGDAFLAITAPLLANGASMQDAAFIGNVVGGIKVGVVGHRRAVDKASVKKAITGIMK